MSVRLLLAPLFFRVRDAARGCLSLLAAAGCVADDSAQISSSIDLGLPLNSRPLAVSVAVVVVRVAALACLGGAVPALSAQAC